ncbi:MAG: helix-turn-helix transcriptional regulator [Bacilli bacterium]
MQNDAILATYKPLVTFIASVIGDVGEVVLHDLSQPETSIVAIENGHMSGRKVGDSTTNLILKILQEKSYMTEDFIGSYKAHGMDGRTFRSSSFFIKNKEQELIGMLCVNVCVEMHLQMKDWLDSFLSFSCKQQETEPNRERKEVKVQEYLHSSPEDVLQSTIEQTVINYNIPPERMSPQEKKDIVRALHDQGVFLLKGGVNAVAKHLKISEPTVYRYLNKIKEQQEV